MTRKYTVQVTDASKDGEIVKFTIQTKTNESEESEGGKIVLRQYEDFEYLLHCLTTRTDVSALIIPPLPSKPLVVPTTESKINLKPSVTKLRSGDEYYLDCKRLQQFIQDIADHPTLQQEEALEIFLTSEEGLKDKTEQIAEQVYQNNMLPSSKNRTLPFNYDGPCHVVFESCIQRDLSRKGEQRLISLIRSNNKPPARAATKKGLIDSFINVVDNARFQHYKDVDEEFQKRRDNNNMLLLHTKQCNAAKTKYLTADNVCTSHNGNIAMTCRNSATVDIQNSKTITRFLGKFSDTLDELLIHQQKATSITEDTLGFSLELYSRNLFACQEMLFRRTCKMVDRENAIKALEKAKPKNREQLLTTKEEAEKVFDEVTETAGVEFETFTEKRITHFRDSLTSLAERHIENYQNTCDMLSKVINDLKADDSLE